MTASDDGSSPPPSPRATKAAASPLPPTPSRRPLLGSPAPAEDSCGPRRRRPHAAAEPHGDDDALRPSPSPEPRALEDGDDDNDRQRDAAAIAAAAAARRPPRLTPPPSLAPPAATPPPPPAHNCYWEHARPLRARAAADDGTRLYYEVHGLGERRRRALQRRAGPVPRPPCWSAAGYLAQSSGGAALPSRAGDDDDDDDDGDGDDDDADAAAGAAAPAAPGSAKRAPSPVGDDPESDDPRPRVLLIMGLACGASAWRWTVPDLVAPLELPAGGPAPVVVAALDNRGCGSSDAPADPARYTTEIMAADARRVLEDLGWWRRRPAQADADADAADACAPSSAPPPPLRARPVHIVGFSMGGMIALKLAASVALAPDPSRHAVASLTVLSASGGGIETIPWRSPRGMRTALCIALARSPEAAAEATLGMHFARRTLRAPVLHHSPSRGAAGAAGAATTPGRDGGGGTRPEGEREQEEQQQEQQQQQQQPPPPLVRRLELLRREYLVRSSSSQPSHGFGGQLRACWRHRFTDGEARAVRRSHFPTLVLHGRRDLLAAPALGERLARRLRCPSVHLEGAHFIVRECAAQVNALLVAVALAGPGGGVADGCGAAGGVAAASAAAASWQEDAEAPAAPAAPAMSPPPGLPRFARAPREAQATWHLEPSPVVQAMWGDNEDGEKAPEGGAAGGLARRRAKGAAIGMAVGEGGQPRVTARAL